MHCTQVLGQQVAVAVGLEGDPLGKKVLGLLVSVSIASASGISGVIGILEGIATLFSFLSAEVTVGSSAAVSLFLSCTAAKKIDEFDAIASSLPASLVLCILLGASLILLSVFVFTGVSGDPSI